MTYNVLLYGATGYTGRLIAAEAKRMHMSRTGRAYRMILGARDGAELRKVAKVSEMDFRVFGLDHRADILKGLEGIDVVVNAAGPFAFTAERLLKAAIISRCNYVDINGEADVYMKLDDLDLKAQHRGVAVVMAAGNTAAASDVLMDAALEYLFPEEKGSKPKQKRLKPEGELGAIRIAMSQILDFSRGSAETVTRSLREQVIVVRKGQERTPGGGSAEKLVIWHEPVGKLEQTFDFGEKHQDDDDPSELGLQIASAANLVDTLTARLTVDRRNLLVGSIESYVQASRSARIAYQLAGTFASVSALPLVRGLVSAQLSMLPDGPGDHDLRREKHVVVLEIEDVYQQVLIDWLLRTPNVYQFTAQLAVEVARKVAYGQRRGWLTPAEILGLKLNDLEKPDPRGFLRGCQLKQRKRVKPGKEAA
jgi:short subunit dehydrogenase-like uncharacterized protein